MVGSLLPRRPLVQLGGGAFGRRGLARGTLTRVAWFRSLGTVSRRVVLSDKSSIEAVAVPIREHLDPKRGPLQNTFHFAQLPRGFLRPLLFEWLIP